MISAIFGNKVGMAVLAIIVGLAVWKINNGDVLFILDTIWQWINNAADQLVKVWEHFTGPDRGKG